MTSHWNASELTRPCICGVGELTIRCQSENYPPFRVESDVDVNCKHCRATYHLWKRGFSPMEYSRLSDIAARGVAVGARWKAWDTDTNVVAMRSRLHRKLEAMPSLAARWRWLREHQYYAPCLAGFRRDYQADPFRRIADVVLSHRRRLPTLSDASIKWETFVFPNIPVFVGE